MTNLMKKKTDEEMVYTREGARVLDALKGKFLAVGGLGAKKHRVTSTDIECVATLSSHRQLSRSHERIHGRVKEPWAWSKWRLTHFGGQKRRHAKQTKKGSKTMRIHTNARDQLNQEASDREESPFIYV